MGGRMCIHCNDSGNGRTSQPQDQKYESTTTVDQVEGNVPQTLEDLLSETHRCQWEPAFREFLQSADDAEEVKKRKIKVPLLDFVLGLHQLQKVLRRDQDVPRSSSSATALENKRNPQQQQNIFNETQELCEQLYKTFFHPRTATTKLPMYNTQLRTSFAKILSEHPGWKSPALPVMDGQTLNCDFTNKLLKTIQEVHNDEYVWKRLSGYCEQFVRKTLERVEAKSKVCKTMEAILLSIL